MSNRYTLTNASINKTSIKEPTNSKKKLKNAIKCIISSPLKLFQYFNKRVLTQGSYDAKMDTRHDPDSVYANKKAANKEINKTIKTDRKNIKEAQKKTNPTHTNTASQSFPDVRLLSDKIMEEYNCDVSFRKTINRTIDEFYGVKSRNDTEVITAQVEESVIPPKQRASMIAALVVQRLSTEQDFNSKLNKLCQSQDIKKFLNTYLHKTKIKQEEFYDFSSSRKKPEYVLKPMYQDMEHVENNTDLTIKQGRITKETGIDLAKGGKYALGYLPQNSKTPAVQLSYHQAMYELANQGITTYISLVPNKYKKDDKIYDTIKAERDYKKAQTQAQTLSNLINCANKPSSQWEQQERANTNLHKTENEIKELANESFKRTGVCSQLNTQYYYAQTSEDESKLEIYRVNKNRKIYKKEMQLKIYNWQDQVVNNNLDGMIDHIQQMKEDSQKPYIHCAAGVGRTGTLAALIEINDEISQLTQYELDNLQNNNEALNELVAVTIGKLKGQRHYKMVQTLEQYEQVQEGARIIFNRAIRKT